VGIAERFGGLSSLTVVQISAAKSRYRAGARQGK
jgi:hypothetical protein